MERYDFAELTPEELEVLQELEQTFSHIKGRYIALVAYDLGEAEAFEEYDEEYDEASFVTFSDWHEIDE